MKNFKQLIYLILVILINCRNDESPSATNNPPNPEQGEDLSQYIYKGCNGFVEFNSNDKSFLLYLRSIGVDKNGDTKISCSEAQAVTEIDFGDRGAVSNIEGIEAFSNLKKISGAIKYPSNGNKTVLNLYNNNKLEEIDFSNYIITGTNGGLTTVANGAIHTIVLPNMSTLKKMTITHSYFEDLKNTQKQVNLEYLNLDNAGVKGNLDLSNCNKLIEIDLSRNILLNNIIFSTKTNNNLISLKLGSGNSGSIGCNLKTLNTSTFPNLKILDLRFNNIENLDISKNINLEKLNIDANELTDLNVKKNQKLKELTLSYNKIPNIDLTQNNSITTLHVSNNFLSTIDLSNLIDLLTFHCSGNLLTNLDFTKNLKLKYVFAKKNSLTYVNFKNVSRNILSADFRENNNLKCITIDNGFIPSTVPIYPSTVPKWQIDSGTNFCY
jgi:hypothetical protein